MPVQIFLFAILLLSLFGGSGHAQTTGWFLCADAPHTAKLFHDSKPITCSHRIGIVDTAFLVGGVNKGYRVNISHTGDFVYESNQRPTYLPRGMSILILNASIMARPIIYVWNTHSFFTIPPFVLQDQKKSFAWHLFDKRFDAASYAITIRKTPWYPPTFFGLTSNQPPLPLQEVPVGRFVKIDDVMSAASAEMREIEFLDATGYVDDKDLRILSRPKLSADNSYYVGSGLVGAELKKSCRTSQPVTSLRPIVTDGGANERLILATVIELAENSGSIKLNNRSGERELSENVHISSIDFAMYDPPNPFSQLIGGDQPIRRDFSFTNFVDYCASKPSGVLIITQRARQFVTDVQIVIRNEDEYEYWRLKLEKHGFSTDEAFFILSRVART